MEKVINRLMIITLAAAILFGALTYHFRNAEHDSVFREELTLPLCEYIDIDLMRLPVIVIPYDGEKISLSYTSDLPIMISTGDNSLKITESDEFMISLFTGIGNDFGLYLYLPHHIFRDISVYTNVGDVKIGRVDCHNMSVTTNSGDILCENLISPGSFTTTDGRISINYDEIITKIEIFSREGDVDLDFPKNSSVAVDFETMTGSCKTKLWGGAITGSYLYSFNGGKNVIKATLEEGTLTIKEKG